MTDTPSQERKVLCIYDRGDLDGICSAAIVYQKFPDALFIPYKHGDDIPWDTIAEYGIDRDLYIYIVDTSFTPYQFYLFTYFTEHGYLYWIDHHEDAIEKIKKSGMVLAGKQDIAKAACALTWEFLFPILPVPYVVTQVSNYDLWQHNEIVIAYQFGLRYHLGIDPGYTCPVYAHPVWGEILKDAGPGMFLAIDKDILTDGHTVRKYHEQQCKKYLQAYGFEATWTVLGKEYRVYACNNGMAKRELFDALPEIETYDILLTFCRTQPTKDGAAWKISLRTAKEDIDLRPIAQEFGGGGHKKAASFRVKSLPSFLYT